MYHHIHRASVILLLGFGVVLSPRWGVADDALPSEAPVESIAENQADASNEVRPRLNDETSETSFEQDAAETLIHLWLNEEGKRKPVRVSPRKLYEELIARLSGLPGPGDIAFAEDEPAFRRPYWWYPLNEQRNEQQRRRGVRRGIERGMDELEGRRDELQQKLAQSEENSETREQIEQQLGRIWEQLERVRAEREQDRATRRERDESGDRRRDRSRRRRESRRRTDRPEMQEIARRIEHLRGAVKILRRGNIDDMANELQRRADEMQQRLREAMKRRQERAADVERQGLRQRGELQRTIRALEREVQELRHEVHEVRDLLDKLVDGRQDDAEPESRDDDEEQ
jgi:hypothetical protein